MISRSNRSFLLVVFLLVNGCIRHKTTQDFGLTSPPTRRAPTSPDTSLRALFQQQTKGAFNPLSDDPRIRTLQSRLTMNPGEVDTRLELGALYENYRLYNDALEQYTEALHRRPGERAILGIARCYQSLDRGWRAIPLLEQFLKEATSGPAWNALGLLYDASADLKAGENAYREAVAANPLADQWHNNLGYNLLLQNTLDAAEDEFQKSLTLNPKSVTAHNNLGMLLARRGDLDGALTQFLFNADEATARNNLAVVLMEFGKYEQSRDELVKALALRRNFAPALSNFKLVQERIRLQAGLQKRGPESNVRVASTNADDGAQPQEKKELTPLHEVKEQR